MSLKIKDTLAHNIQFNDQISLYTCGPTIYRNHHIANLRVCHTSSVICRYSNIMYGGYEYHMNFTDIGHLDVYGNDKIIDYLDHDLRNVFYLNISQYASNYVDDLMLHFMEMPRFHNASDYIEEYINHIRGLDEKGFIIHKEDGLYMNINKLSIPDSLLLYKGKRLEDFCVWRLSDKGLFRSIYGTGTPGWHIECFAIVNKIKQNSYKKRCNIHVGGFDLADIHHNCEIAHCYANDPHDKLCDAWMHVGLVTINGKKVSKSEMDDISHSLMNNLSVFNVNYLYAFSNYRKCVNIDSNYINMSNKFYKRIANLIFDALSSMGIHQINDMIYYLSYYENKHNWSDVSCEKIRKYINLTNISNDINVQNIDIVLVNLLQDMDLLGFAITDYVCCLNFINYFINRMKRVYRDIYLYNKINYYSKKNDYDKCDQISKKLNLFIYKKDKHVYLY